MVSDLNSKRKSINNNDKNEKENKNIENQGKMAQRNSRIISAFIDYSNKKNKNITPKNEKENNNNIKNVDNNNKNNNTNNSIKSEEKSTFLRANIFNVLQKKNDELKQEKEKNKEIEKGKQFEISKEKEKSKNKKRKLENENLSNDINSKNESNNDSNPNFNYYKSNKNTQTDENFTTNNPKNNFKSSTEKINNKKNNSKKNSLKFTVQNNQEQEIESERKKILNESVSDINDKNKDFSFEDEIDNQTERVIAIEDEKLREYKKLHLKRIDQILDNDENNYLLNHIKPSISEMSNNQLIPIEKKELITSIENSNYYSMNHINSPFEVSSSRNFEFEPKELEDINNILL